MLVGNAYAQSSIREACDAVRFSKALGGNVNDDFLKRCDAIDGTGTEYDVWLVLLPYAGLVALSAVVYFMVLRPIWEGKLQREQRARLRREVIASVRNGDTVAMDGGIIGRVLRTDVAAGQLIVEVADGVEVRVVRSSVSSVLIKCEPSTNPVSE